MQINANRIGFSNVHLRRIFTSDLRYIKVALLLISLLGVGGCEFIYLHYSNCGYYDGPILDRLTLRQPVLNQVYSDQVRIRLDSDSHIEAYDVRYEFDGSLPPGISYYQHGRSVILEGVAISPGSYSFTLIVEARYFIRDRIYYYYNDYCTYRTSRHYLLTVEPF